MYKLPLSAEEIKRRLLDHPEGWHEIAHDEYDPTSQYAQSGIAVAQAISGLATEESVNSVNTNLTNKIDNEITRATQAEENLQHQLDVIMNNPDTEGIIDSIDEFTQYITDHGQLADGFRTDINKNAEDIAALEESMQVVYSGTDLWNRGDGINASNKVQLYGPRVEQSWKVGDIYIDTYFNAIFKCIVCGLGADGNDYWYAEWEKLGDISYIHPTTHDVGMITGLASVATSGNYSDLTGTPTIPTGAAANKGVDTSISDGSTSTNLPTSKAVATFVEGKGYKTTDNNYYHTPTATSGLKVATGNGVADMYVPVDDSLSPTSTNPVQNKAVKQYVDAKPTVYVSETAPSTTVIGSIWIDTSVTSVASAEEVI